MEQYFITFDLIVGVLLALYSFIIEANKNFTSKLIFNIFPFIAGLGLLFQALYSWGFIVKV